ncbi:MAG: L,D-transpeptidase family protein [Syntrophomonadaceae bacterium]|nr:L,D-transpeptidase family protein [Syntrophomonadaceae bacterium]
MIYASRFLRYEPDDLMQGPDVLEIQELLKNAGYKVGQIDGTFGLNTEQAVIKFQSDHQILADGIVGPNTWNLLNFYASSNQRISQAKLPRIHVDVDKRRLTFYNTDGTSKTYKVAVGRRSNPTPLGNWVITQKALNPGGPFGARWMRLSVPWGGYGIHGTNNPSSIGKAVSHGCIRLYNEDVIEIYDLTPIGTPVTIVGSGYSARPLRLGDSGKDVVQVQKMLKKLKYYKYKVDGQYGVKTEAAVKKFQGDKGLVVDGIVGPDTYEALYKAYDKANKSSQP